MKVKSFRGKIADAGIVTIRLGTNNGLTGYRIRKFELMPYEPGGTTTESVVKLHTSTQTGTPTATIDFDDPTLLATAFMALSDSHVYPVKDIVIFDNTTFNQDIHVTHQNTGGTTAAINYYIELEAVKLDLNEATVATLKDMRAGPDTNFGP
tara:strand:- start:1210 stop:1665 length:456 start_codon:yes stop_codon:yes gene_type:complete